MTTVSGSAESLLKELSEVGWPVASVSELVNTKRAYPEAVPVLIRWLESLDDGELRKQQRDVEQVVRALAVSAARGKAAPTLVALFRRVQDPTGMGIRWAVGNTLEVVADDSVADELIGLATDRRYGPARQMVVLGFGRLRSERAEATLIELLKDDEVAAHAAMALGKLGSTRAVPALSGLLQHAKPWVRKEAMKALTKIQG